MDYLARKKSTVTYLVVFTVKQEWQNDEHKHFLMRSTTVNIDTVQWEERNRDFGVIKCKSVRKNILRNIIAS